MSKSNEVNLITDVSQKPVKSVEDVGKLVADLKSEGLSPFFCLFKEMGKRGL